MEANLIRYVDGCFQISMLSGLSKLNLNNEVVGVVETGKDINILIPWKLCYQHISSCGQCIFHSHKMWTWFSNFSWDLFSRIIKKLRDLIRVPCEFFSLINGVNRYWLSAYLCQASSVSFQKFSIDQGNGLCFQDISLIWRDRIIYAMIKSSITSGIYSRVP